MTATPFDPTVPLPEGVSLLEASAGTGKTHTVASVVVGEVAEGRPLDELLVVTFTRKATGTLRERVWQRLTEARRALEPGTPLLDDPVLAHVQRGDEEDRVARRARLDRALSDFDAATIATTHGFCQQVLAGLGVAGDAERDLEVVDDVSELVREAVDDLFVRRFHGGGPVLFNRATAIRIAEAVVNNPDARIAPVAPDSDAEKLRRKFAVTLRQRIIEQKRQGRLVTYDDLLTRLADNIDDQIRGPIVAERLRRRFSMAIVDEFQDTDTVQWRILRTAFGAAPCRLVLVGDPKQAVYAFRGGDVHAYLRATEGATRRTLDTSWRSDQPLLDGLDAFFGGAQLGAASIRHHPLHARPGAEQRRLCGPDVGAPLTVRLVDRATGQVALTPTGLATKASARACIATDVAAEARRLLSSGTTVVERDAEGNDLGERPLVPGDIAVLVRRNADADAVRAALQTVGIPAVGHGGASVFATESARHWLELLKALEQPGFTARLHGVALGPFFGWDAPTLATASDDQWDHLDDVLHDLRAAVRNQGLAGVLRRVEASEGLSARLLGQVGGERELSDLRHLAELVDGWQSGHPTSIAVLIRGLTEQIAEADRDSESARRRLESDADAVAVHTIHGAKGLEFPVVLLPSMWEGPWTPPDVLPVFHDEQGERCVGVGGRGQVHDYQVAVSLRERDDEELRLLYVALTRARHHVVLWWVTSGDARSSAFARVLLGKDDQSGAVVQQLPRPPDEDAVRARLEELGVASKGSIEVRAAGPAVVPPAVPHPAAGGDLDVARFGRGFDRQWVRTSYSSLTAAAHDHATTVSVDLAAVDLTDLDAAITIDELATETDGATTSRAGARRAPVPGTDSTPAARRAPVPLGDLPGGARVGTMVHEVFERIDFRAADLPTEVATAAEEAGAHRLVDGHVDALVAGLVAALRTPLGPLFDGNALCELSRRDRLDELTFDLPLAGGDQPHGHLTMAAVADVFSSTLEVHDPLTGYHERLLDPILETSVRGFLTGSIDLVARVDHRYVVVDYKTNRLAPPGELLTRWHYRPDAMAAAMQDAHYPLQAALYAVALHRYLRWRLPGYDPAQHLGGVAYLFIRGMTGPDDAAHDAPDGVFSWRPPVAFVTALSDVFDRGAS
jgi:exodeoxyribonuclease V beta subunit